MISSTPFDDLTHVWCERSFADDDHHPSPTSPSGDYVYYDPWSCRKIDEHSTKSRESATRCITGAFRPVGRILRILRTVFVVMRVATLCRHISTTNVAELGV